MRSVGESGSKQRAELTHSPHHHEVRQRVCGSRRLRPGARHGRGFLRLRQLRQGRVRRWLQQDGGAPVVHPRAQAPARGAQVRHRGEAARPRARALLPARGPQGPARVLRRAARPRTPARVHPRARRPRRPRPLRLPGPGARH